MQSKTVKTSSEVELMETKQRASKIRQIFRVKTSSEVELMETARYRAYSINFRNGQNFFGS